MKEEMNIGTGYRMMNEDKKNKLNNDNFLVTKFSRRRSKHKGKTNISPVNSNESRNKNSISSKKRNSDNLNIYSDNNKKIGLYNNNTFNIDENKQKGRDIVSKVKVTRACVYLCFCFTRRRKIIQNYLLDEGMNIISEKLDVFNIFEKMYKDEEIMEKMIYNKTIQMSDECKINYSL